MAKTKKKLPKKNAAKRPSVSRAKPAPKACCGRLRGHAPDCQGEVGDPGAAPLEPIEAAAPAVAADDAEAPVQPGPYLAAIQSIALSLEGICSALALRALKALPEGPPAAEATPRKPRKAKEASEPAPAAGGPPPPAYATQDPAPAPSEGHSKPAGEACRGCGSTASVHKSDCPVKYPKPLTLLPATPAPAPAAPTVEQVRSVFLSYASAMGRDAAVALLARFGAAKVAEIPAEQFPAFLGALKGEA